VNATEQTLLFASTALVLAGTLVVFVMQVIRGRRRDRGDGSDQ